MRYKQVNDAVVPLSPEEEAAFDAQEAAWRVERRASLIQQAKASAGEAITTALPTWRQSNLHTRYLTLLRRGETQWTAEEQTEVKQLEAAWAWIDAVRRSSSTLEERLRALPDNQLDTFVWGPTGRRPPRLCDPMLTHAKDVTDVAVGGVAITVPFWITILADWAQVATVWLGLLLVLFRIILALCEGWEQYRRWRKRKRSP